MPTQVGSGRIVVRYLFEGGWFIRCIEPSEGSRLIGWDGCMWDPYEPLDAMEKLLLSSNLAGNAFTVSHYHPVLLATLGAFGCFCVGYEALNEMDCEDASVDPDGGAQDECDDDPPESADASSSSSSASE